MRQNGIAAKTKRKFRCTTDSNHGHPVAENVVNRDFKPTTANRTWTADITYIATGEGWLYLAVVEDLYSKQIIGWSMGSRIDSRLVVDALEMGKRHVASPAWDWWRTRIVGASTPASTTRGYWPRHEIVCGMSRRANCWDNAPIESFFASLKKELTHGESFATRAEARSSLFEYIEVFYNRSRRHSSLGYLSPAEYERAG